jgi:hypothetical protein
LEAEMARITKENDEELEDYRLYLLEQSYDELVDISKRIDTEKMSQHLFLEIFEFYYMHRGDIGNYGFIKDNMAVEMFEKLKTVADELEKERWRQDEVYYWVAKQYKAENKDHSYFDTSSVEKVETKVKDEALENNKDTKDHQKLKELTPSEATIETTFCDIISDKLSTEPETDIVNKRKPQKKRKISFKSYTLKKEWRSVRHFNRHDRVAHRVRCKFFLAKVAKNK